MPVSIRKITPGGRIEVRILSETTRQTGVLHLTPHEARRMAAALLLQSSPEGPDLEDRAGGDGRPTWRTPYDRRRIRAAS